MPRPKVKPQDRQRSVRACDACKASKKRCDANQPCRLCIKKGTQNTCTYTPTARGKRSRASLMQQSDATFKNGVGSRPKPTSSIAVENNSPTDFRSILTGSTQRSRPLHCEQGSSEHLNEDIPDVDEDADSETENLESRNSVERSTQKPVMLSSSSGDKVFVGNTAALSFLQFLQRTLKHYVGPSGFTNRQHSHSLFEVASSDINSEVFHDSLDQDEKSILIRCYLDASSGFLDLYTQEELARLVESSISDQTTSASSSKATDRTTLASLYLMIAIGAQVRGSPKDDAVRASKYFTQGRKIAFEKWLEEPTVSLVRTFVLMAFYMFGACRRNSAFMYLGVAAKSADILGLHAAAQNRHMSKAERDSRLRVAKSIRVFDIICSSILGRRPSAPQLRSVDISPGDIEQDPVPGCHRALALRATYESCSILETVVGKFADDGSLNTCSAEHYLQLLREWSQVLPASLRQRPRKDNVGPSRQGDANSREIMIANVHVAGTYYFGIILITRQFLIQHISPQLRGQRRKSSQGMGDSHGINGKDESATLAELSRACIEAATYQAQMCREAVDAGVLLGNMCIIKAWVFAAGLVLGFSLLADDPSDGDTREAFRGAQHVLHTLGRLSAQAAQYHQILSAFSEAIDVYRRQKRSERNIESRVPFVEQILSYDSNNNNHRHNQHSYYDATVSFSSSVSGNDKNKDMMDGDGGDEGGGMFDQFIPSGSSYMCASNVDQTLGKQQQEIRNGHRASQEMGSSSTTLQQLPTPDINADDPQLNGIEGARVGEGGGGGYWNGSDTLSSMSVSDFTLPENWPLLPPTDSNNDLMLRLLWDGYAMSFDESALLGPAPGQSAGGTGTQRGDGTGTLGLGRNTTTAV